MDKVLFITEMVINMLVVGKMEKWKDRYINQGVLIFPNGDMFQGKFDRFLEKATGVMSYTDGRVEEGIVEQRIFTAFG